MSIGQVVAALGHVGVSAFAFATALELTRRLRATGYRPIRTWATICYFASAAAFLAAITTLPAASPTVDRLEMIFCGALVPGAMIAAGGRVVGGEVLSRRARWLRAALLLTTVGVGAYLWVAVGEVWTPGALIERGSLPATLPALHLAALAFAGIAIVYLATVLAISARALNQLPEFQEMRRGLIRALSGVLFGIVTGIGFYGAIGSDLDGLAPFLALVSEALSTIAVASSALTLSQLQPIRLSGGGERDRS